MRIDYESTRHNIYAPIRSIDCGYASHNNQSERKPKYNNLHAGDNPALTREIQREKERIRSKQNNHDRRFIDNYKKTLKNEFSNIFLGMFSSHFSRS